MEKFGGIENALNQKDNTKEQDDKMEKNEEVIKKIKSLSKGAQKIAMVFFGLAAGANMANASVEEVKDELANKSPEIQKMYEDEIKKVSTAKEQFFASVADKLGFSDDELEVLYSEEIEYGDFENKSEENGKLKNENICVANFGNSYMAEVQDEDKANVYDQLGLKTVFYGVKEGVELNSLGSYQVEASGYDEHQAIVNGIRESIAFTGTEMESERMSSQQSGEKNMGGYFIDTYSKAITMKSANCIESYEVLSSEDLPGGGKKVSIKVNFANKASH